jgi:hypothetical protein
MTPPDTSGAERQRWLCRAIVQEGRAAATRGLLHDFSNVMVGLCSISENAVEDVPEDNPLHDDLAIIRDSSMRAYQLIRRIVQLNAVDPGEPDLIECRSWMAGELESLRAVLPKGSSVTVDESSPVLFLRTREDALRDAFMVLSLAAARRHRARVSLTLAVRKGAGQVGFTVTDRASMRVRRPRPRPCRPRPKICLRTSRNAAHRSSAEPGTSRIRPTAHGA